MAMYVLGLQDCSLSLWPHTPVKGVQIALSYAREAFQEQLQ